MKKKTAILLAGTMIASTILAGCGSKEEGAANQVASEELKGGSQNQELDVSLPLCASQPPSYQRMSIFP